MKTTGRRRFLASGIGLVSTSALRADVLSGPALGNRAHFSAPPAIKEQLIACFRDVLGCGPPATLHAPGLAEPILAFKFPGGGSLSIELTGAALDDSQARRGAWLEIRSNDPAALKKRILDAGLPEVTYPATNTFYFAAPGGQVFGIVPAANPSAGELKGQRPDH